MTKRARGRKAETNKAISAHLRRLGCESEPDYFAWCERHGFGAHHRKNADDRNAELSFALSHSLAWNSHLPELRSVALPRHLNAIPGEIRDRFSESTWNQRRCQNVQQALLLLDSVGQPNRALLRYFGDLLERLYYSGVDVIASKRPAVRYLPFRACTFLEALAMVAKHRQRWIRPLNHWRPASKVPVEAFRALIQHLFAQYPMSASALNCWFDRTRFKSSSHIDVFLHLAAGHSIRTARIPLSQYSRRMSSGFASSPANLSLTQAVRYGQAIGYGLEHTMAIRVARSFLGRKFRHEAFWNTVLAWFGNQPHLSEQFVTLLLDYLNNQKYGVGNFYRMVLRNGMEFRELTPPAHPNLTMRGRAADALVREAQRWREQMDSLKGNDLVWNSSGLLPMSESYESAEWQMTELIGNAALVQDGIAMSHCVGSYASCCALGESSIWSLQKTVNGITRRVLTVEVDLDDMEIVQARGYSNRAPSDDESHILCMWARLNELQIHPEASDID